MNLQSPRVLGPKNEPLQDRTTLMTPKHFINLPTSFDFGYSPVSPCRWLRAASYRGSGAGARHLRRNAGALGRLVLLTGSKRGCGGGGWGFGLSSPAGAFLECLGCEEFLPRFGERLWRPGLCRARAVGGTMRESGKFYSCRGSDSLAA